MSRRAERNPLLAGFHASWLTVLLIAAINTGIALLLWSDPGELRPFYQPLVTVQLFGFSIAYCVNVAAPWDKAAPVRRLILATAAGALLGSGLVILVKTQIPPLNIYTLDYVRDHVRFFAMNSFSAFVCGFVISLMFLIKFRETRATAALHHERSTGSPRAIGNGEEVRPLP